MIKRLSGLFSLLLLSSVSFSQTKGFQNEIGIRSENDSYLGQGHDRYYTNGLFITFRHAIDQSRLNQNFVKKTWEAEVGQLMFNPQSGRIPDIVYIDRPFAGYLYAGGKMSWFYKSNQLLTISAQIGTIGPNSLARQGQELLHKIIGFYDIEGWQYQVKNEIGINTAIDYTRLITKQSSHVDLSANGAIKAGTTFSGANASLLFRAGKINPLHNSAITNSRVSNNSEEVPSTEFFFYAKPQLQLIAYDATIQGGMIRNDKGPITFDPKRFVFSPAFGAYFAKNRWTVDFSIVMESKRVNVQKYAHQFGSLGLYYRFN